VYNIILLILNKFSVTHKSRIRKYMRKKERILKVINGLEVYYLKFIKIHVLLTLYKFGYNLVILTIIIQVRFVLLFGTSFIWCLKIDIFFVYLYNVST